MLHDLNHKIVAAVCSQNIGAEIICSSIIKLLSKNLVKSKIKISIISDSKCSTRQHLAGIIFYIKFPHGGLI